MTTLLHIPVGFWDNPYQGMDTKRPSLKASAKPYSLQPDVRQGMAMAWGDCNCEAVH